MCAIGGFNWSSEELIRAMNRSMTHRGPDGSDTYVDNNMSLGHNRLAIIDLSERAAQPMRSSNGRFIIVFNGEIYNFKELKNELKEYSFVSESDTEVILAAYIHWGRDCVKRLNGIFAFAIWDTQERELFLARDHSGVKPLYYHWDGKKLIFASEIKAILEHDIPRTLDQEAFSHYMRLLYTPAPKTMFRSVTKLSPGSYAVLSGGSFSVRSYWDVKNEPGTGSYEEHKKRIRTLVEEAVERQLVSDRPLGLYLSGGIDSSVVLASMRKVRSNIDTFSVGFKLREGEEREKFNADFELARTTAAHFGTTHHEVLLEPGEVVPLFKKAVEHLDEPISNPTIIPMFKLSEFVKPLATVVLGGDGGDELFGGYERYRLSRIETIYQKLPRFVRGLFSFFSFFKKLGTPPGIQRFSQFMFQKDSILLRVVREPFFKSAVSDQFFDKNFFAGRSMRDFENLFMEVDRKSWLADESLMRSDKMAMAHGVEARVPLLDPRLVEFAATLSLTEKVDIFSTKKIFKDAFKDVLPAYLFNEPKRGWFSPGAKWLRYPEVLAFAQDVLSPDYYQPTAALFNWEEVATILDDHVRGRAYNLTLIWAILTFQVWARHFKVVL